MQNPHKRVILALTLALGLGLSGSVGAVQLDVSSNVTTDTTWGVPGVSDTVLLTAPIFVKSGATLTILAGTVVRGVTRTALPSPGVTAGTPGALIVTQAGKIIAEGTASAPIVFTTGAVDNDGDGAADDLDGDGFDDAYPGFVPGSCPACVADPTPTYLDADPLNDPLAPLDSAGSANLGMWGGIVILGEAPTNLGADALGPADLGKQTVEGLTVPGFPPADAIYGGVNGHDDSGRLRYISVRHAGDEIGNGNELNGITLGGVGDATVFENIEVYCNFDDGIEWFGGNVNGKNLHVAFAGDDTFDLDQGYNGTNQFLFGVMPFFNQNDGSSFGSSSGDKGGEWDGDDFDEPTTPEHRVAVREDYDTAAPDGCLAPVQGSATSMINVTIIGSYPDVANPATSPAGAGNRGIQMRNGFGGQLVNGIVVNTGAAAPFDISGGGTVTGSDPCDDFTTPARVDRGEVLVQASTLDYTTASVPGGATDEDEALANGDGKDTSTTADDNVLETSATSLLVNENTAFDPDAGSTGYLSGATSPATNPRPTITDVGAPVGPTLVNYRGAFDPAAPELWTTGWTVLNRAGMLVD